MRQNKIIYGVARNDSIMYSNKCKELWYDVWMGMLRRCYSSKFHEKYPSYIGCYVCDEWLLASNFKQWFTENYINGYELDKDIKYINNKIYSPQTCLFIPKELNLLFLDNHTKNTNLPIGVTYIKKSNTYTVRVNKFGKRIYCGCKKTINEAKELYIHEKINHLNNVIFKFKDDNKITKDIFNILINKVNILYGDKR